MPRTTKNPHSENGTSEEKDEEVIEYDEDYSPKRGLTFIFASAGFSLFLLAVLAGLSPYLIPKIAGVEYYQNVLYGFYNVFPLIYTIAINALNWYSHLFYLTYAIASTCVAALVAALLYFSWSGEKKLFPDSSLIGLSVSIFSLFIQYGVTNLFFQYESIIIKYYLSIQNLTIIIGYALDWVGIIVLLALGTLSGSLGLKLSKRLSTK